MMRRAAWPRLASFLREEGRKLVSLQYSDRPWQMPLAAALASGLPIMVGASLGHLQYGLAASLGGQAFLYLPETHMAHRMVVLMACAFGMIACYALGLTNHLYPAMLVPVLIFTVTVVSMLCRYYMLGPPGSLFFVMAAAIGAYSPVAAPQLPHMLGLFTMGALGSCLVGFLYSSWMLRVRPAKLVKPLPAAGFEFVVMDSVVIGGFVGISLVLAELLHMERTYWVPVSCLVVMQGASFRAIWSRHLHRVLGTGIGLLLAWLLLTLRLDPWSVALTMTALSFVIEMIITRNYAMATIFITPLTILLADNAAWQEEAAGQLMQARFYDTLLGCGVGLAGGACMHSRRFRALLAPLLRALVPRRFSR